MSNAGSPVGSAAETASQSIQLSSDLQYLPGVGLPRARLLARLGLRAAGDALFYFPRGYDFPAPPQPLENVKDGVPASVCGTITDIDLRTAATGKTTLGILVEAEGHAVRLVYFNQAYRRERLERGMRVLVEGTPRLSGLRMEFRHPELHVLGPDETPRVGAILPRYGLTEGLKQTQLRRIIGPLAEQLAEVVPEVLPASLRDQAGQQLGVELPEIATSLKTIHAPESAEQLERARTRLVFQELLVMQLALALRRRKLTTDLSAPPLTPTAPIDARIRSRFPFQLTGDQQRTMNEVGRDMGRQFPMNRLVQGDVGSGKTVIAQYAMLLAVAHRYQALLMAPTEILAAQHFETFRRALERSRVRIGLLTGSLSAAQRQGVTAALAAGELDVLVGTQALLYGDLNPQRLGLVVIDEQHKFGVGQRASLRSGGLDPHYLVLSATPIPRTLAMTMFGDLEVSTLREKPPGRKPVQTYLGRTAWRERWWQFTREQLDAGRQAFVVTPRVEGGDELAASNAQDVYRELIARPLKSYRVGLLHGQLSAQEKEQTMRRFAQGRLQVLVTTTVIEVGIDIPNATVMTILGAEHFGLAQLHQLRGRVSRGSVGGHVCVFTDSQEASEENERLRVFAETADGFELAEADFRLRGPGDLMGTRQSGMPPLRIADLQRDQDILQVARQIAQEIIDDDPDLHAPERARLRRQVLRRYGQVLDLGDVA